MKWYHVDSQRLLIELSTGLPTVFEQGALLPSADASNVTRLPLGHSEGILEAMGTS